MKRALDLHDRYIDTTHMIKVLKRIAHGKEEEEKKNTNSNQILHSSHDSQFSRVTITVCSQANRKTKKKQQHNSVITIITLAYNRFVGVDLSFIYFKLADYRSFLSVHCVDLFQFCSVYVLRSSP